MESFSALRHRGRHGRPLHVDPRLCGFHRRRQSGSPIAELGTGIGRSGNCRATRSTFSAFQCGAPLTDGARVQSLAQVYCDVVGAENIFFDKPGREGGLMQENEAANAVMRVLWLFE